MRTENWAVVPDDRQTRIDTIGGVIVQDFGRVEAADNYSCSVTVEAAGAIVISAYWQNRVPVPVRDVSGLVIPDMRVVVKKYGYVDRFEGYVWAELEFWRV